MSCLGPITGRGFFYSIRVQRNIPKFCLINSSSWYNSLHFSHFQARSVMSIIWDNYRLAYNPALPQRASLASSIASIWPNRNVSRGYIWFNQTCCHQLNKSAAWGESERRYYQLADSGINPREPEFNWHLLWAYNKDKELHASLQNTTVAYHFITEPMLDR